MKPLLVLLVPIMICGCATQYQYKGSDKPAWLHLTGNTRQFFVEAYDDANCKLSEGGTRLATFFGPIKDVPDDQDGKTVAIPAGKPFIFTNYYIDARYAQNRTCGLTVSFTPESGKTYESYFYVDAEVTGCDTAVGDQGSKPEGDVASFKYTENFCLGGANKGPTNRKGNWINWRVNVVRSKK